MNGWTWTGSTPAVYGADESAHKWGGGLAGTPGGTVNYYFDPGSGFTPGIESMYVSALTLWSDLANIDFVQTADPATAQLNFYLFNTSTPGVPLDKGAYATAVYQAGKPGDTTVPATQAAAVSIEQTGSWAHLDSFSYAGGYGPSTIVHEFGHVLGLIHTGPYNGDVNSPVQQYNATDMYIWSTMSYIQPDDTAAKYYNQYPVQGTNYNLSGGPTTPQILDILSAQQLYGLSTSTTFSGGQVFGFHSNISDAAGRFYDFTQNADPVVTMWDYGTGNSLDLSGFFTPSNVNLNPGTFSSADGMVNNLAIAFDTAIDSAIGGAADDTFTVNANSDTIDGGGGSNTVRFAGAYAAYVVTALGGGSYQVSDGAVTDTLHNVQTLAFADQSVPVADLAAGDTFSWTIGNGAYDDKANWTDLTKGGPAATPPGATDIALLPGPTSGGPQTISGPGTAAQMVFTGLAGVTGALTPDLLAVGQAGGEATLTVAPGAAIVAGSAVVANGTLRINGKLTTTNTMTLAPADAAASSSIQMLSGGIAQVGTLALNGGTITVDATSIFEVGTDGGALTERVTIDSGRVVSGNGSLAAVENDGTVIVSGGRLNISSLTGSTGQVKIAADGTLALGSDTTLPISFAAPTGVLAVGAPDGAVRSLGSIIGFVAGDALSVTALADNKAQPLQQPTYDPQTGEVTIGRVGGTNAVSATLVGDYSPNVFMLLPTGNGVFNLLTAPGTLDGSKVPSAGTADSELFGWSAGQSGDWDNAANWTNIADKKTASVAPGAKDNAIVQGFNQPNSLQVLSGAANVTDLEFTDANAISGNVTVDGTLTVGQIGNPATLALIGTASITAANAAIFGMLDVASDTSLSVANALSVTTDGSQSVAPLEIYGGGSVHAGALILNGPMAPIALDSESRLEVGTLGTAAVGVLTVDPTFKVSGSGDLSAISVADNGSIVANGGTLSVGTVTGNGLLGVGSGATLVLAASEANPIAFTGQGATLLVKNTLAALGTVTGFVQGETIAVAALPQGLPTKVSYTATGMNIGTLNLTNQFGTSITLTLAGDYSTANFILGPGSSPAIADVTIACFAAGTRIATVHGEVAVEDLQEGDLVSAHFAREARPIIWIGHRRIDCRRHPKPRQVWPVRIRAGTFGHGAPARDLLLSPDHAVLVGDVLIPVKYLINGSMISQAEVDEVTYYHVELARHDVLFAERLPAESYLDTGDRASFANGGRVVVAFPDFATRLWEAEGCAPLVITGPLVQAARRLVKRSPRRSRQRRAAA